MIFRFTQIIFVLVALALIVSIYLYRDKKSVAGYIEAIEKGYDGVVLDIYLTRTTNVKIQTTQLEYIEEGMLCDDFIHHVKVGDSIIKIPNENYVWIVDKNTRLRQKHTYLYISKRIRYSYNWPKEWKDKWPESTY